MDRDAILDGLNEGQRAAASAVDGSWLVVAGAGSGKTTVLSRRVAALIAAGVDPGSILLLTFTREAARNMLERARKLHPAASEVFGGTFHSVGHRMIVENHAQLALPERPSIIDPDDVVSAFRKIIAAKVGKGSDAESENMPRPAAIAKIHSLAVNIMATPEDVVDARFSQLWHAKDFIAECVKEYRNFKKERSLLDYDDLLVAWNKMLDHPDLGTAFRKQFRYVMVDEHQDSNNLQCSIVFKLGGDQPNVMAVGDPAQSIYGFRGSAPGTMFSFRDRWPKTNIVTLDVNYRSTAEILEVANAVDRSMEQRFDRALYPVDGRTGDLPKYVTLPSMEDEATYIVDAILARKTDGIELFDQAILARSMSMVRHVEAELVKRRVPYKVSGGIKIGDAAHVKDLLCLVRAAVNVRDELAWVRVLTMAKGVGEKKASTLFRDVSKRDDAAFDPVSIIAPHVAKSPDLQIIIDAYSALRSSRTPMEALEAAAARLDGIFERRYDNWKTRKSDLAAVIGLAESAKSIDAFLSAIMIDYSIDKVCSANPNDGSERGLTLSTVHSSKGLEWTVVYMPSFLNGHYPSFYSSNEPDGIEEEKRILYVAVTRAKQELLITRPALGRAEAIAPKSPFDDMIVPLVEEERFGLARSKASFRFDVGAAIDIFD
jgi:DNA helicase-2/ATP-dependent DNA helicase PcrA